MRVTLITSHEYGLAVARKAALIDDTNTWNLIKIGEDVGRRLLGPRYQSMSSVRDAFDRTIEVEDLSNLSSEAIALVCDSQYVLVVGWPRLLAGEVLDCFKRYDVVAMGFHPSPLPTGRGMSPIPHTILEGLSISAVTAFILEADVDSGPIVARSIYSIDGTDHAEQVYAKAIIAHINCAELVIRQLSEGSLQPQRQLGEVRVWTRIRNEDRVLEESTIDQVDKLVRAHNYPYPRMTFTHLGEIVHISGINQRQGGLGYSDADNRSIVDLLGNGEMLLSIYREPDNNRTQKRGYIMSRDLSDDKPDGDFDGKYSGTVLIRDGLVLLQERDDKPGIINPGGITLFGGAVEEIEDFAEAAARELKEELEIEVEPTALTALGYVSKVEPDMTVTLCSMFMLSVNRAAELVQHEGRGIYAASVQAALENPKVSETCKTTLRALRNVQNTGLQPE